MDYEKDLQNLKEAQKNAAIADLQKSRDTSLSNLTAEEAKLKPTYDAARNTANVQNRVAARNFQEYLANTGRANSGIGAQYEMSRQNSLNNNINALNTQEAADRADIERRRTDAGNTYNTGLAGANAQAEANYINNLLTQRQQQWQNEYNQNTLDTQKAQQQWENTFKQNQLDYQRQQDELNREYQRQQAALAQQQQQWENEFRQRQLDEQIRQYNQSREDSLSKLYSSSKSSSGSSGSSGSKKTSSNSGYNAVNAQLEQLNSNNNTTPTNLFNGLGVAGAVNTNTQMKNAVSDAYNNGLLTDNQVRSLANKYKLF